MRAYDLAGKRGAANVNQADLAAALGWRPDSVREVEQGRIDITEAQYNEIHAAIERLREKEVVEVG